MMGGYWEPFFHGALAVAFVCYIAHLARQFGKADRLLASIDEDYTAELAQAWTEGNLNGLMGIGEWANPFTGDDHEDADAEQDVA